MPLHPKLRGERGASAIVMALFLVAAGSFLALVINVGHLMMVRRQLQNAADSAAMAAALDLDGTSTGLTRARSTAIAYASRHFTDKASSVVVRSSDVIFGAYSGTTFSQILETAPTADIQRINAVRVSVGRESSRGNAMALFFPVFGKATSVDVRAQSTGLGGGPCNNCAVPLAIADCSILVNGAVACGTTLSLSTSTTDNFGFTNLTPGSGTVSTSGVISLLNAGCKSVNVGDVLGLGNGNNLNKNVVDAFSAYVTKYGSLVSIPIVHPTGGCPAKMNTSMSVVGFASFNVTGLVTNPKPSISGVIQCSKASPTRGGCSYFGVKTAPELVQ